MFCLNECYKSCNRPIKVLQEESLQNGLIQEIIKKSLDIKMILIFYFEKNIIAWKQDGLRTKNQTKHTQILKDDDKGSNTSKALINTR